MKRIIITAFIGLNLLPQQAFSAEDSKKLALLAGGVGLGAAASACYLGYRWGSSCKAKELARQQALTDAARTKADQRLQAQNFIHSTLNPILNAHTTQPLNQYFAAYAAYVNSLFYPWFVHTHQYIDTINSMNPSLSADILLRLDQSRTLLFDPYSLVSFQLTNQTDDTRQREMAQLQAALGTYNGRFTFSPNAIKTIKLLQAGARVAPMQQNVVGTENYAATSSAPAATDAHQIQLNMPLVINVRKVNVNDTFETEFDNIIIAWSAQENRYHAYVYEEDLNDIVIVPEALQPAPEAPLAELIIPEEETKRWWQFWK